MLIIIDGYNVLQHMEKGQAGPKEKERFIAALTEQAETTVHKLILVFDGGSTLVPAREMMGKLVVIHTGHHETADDYIARLMQKHSGEPVVAVSSDHQIQAAARRWGAKKMEAAQFAELMVTPDAPAQLPMSRTGSQMIRRTESTDDELALVLETESRSVPIKEDERHMHNLRVKEKQSKKTRKILKKL